MLIFFIFIQLNTYTFFFKIITTVHICVANVAPVSFFIVNNLFCIPFFLLIRFLRFFSLYYFVNVTCFLFIKLYVEHENRINYYCAVFMLLSSGFLI